MRSFGTSIGSSMMQRLLISFLAAFMFFNISAQEIGVRTVVIDPGHGGRDPGAVGPSKIYEKDVVLAVSLKLGEMIKKVYPDVKVIYTRETDKFVGLGARATMANKEKADLFISIHANAAGSRSARGFESWVLGLHKTDAELEVAKKENAVILMEDNYEEKYESFDPNDPESYIWLTMRQSAYLNQSIELAAAVQDEFDVSKRINRGVKQAGFLVLYRTTMPSILIELGFISNPDEEKYLNSEKGQEEMAEGIFKAFSRYKTKVDGVNTAVSHGNSDTQENHTDQETVEQHVPEVESEDKDKVVFKVQVAASPKAVETSPDNFKGHANVDEYISGGMYKYTLGSSYSFDEANALKTELRESDFPSAFVVAFLNGERIDLNKARELAKQ